MTFVSIWQWFSYRNGMTIPLKWRIFKFCFLAEIMIFVLIWRRRIYKDLYLHACGVFRLFDVQSTALFIWHQLNIKPSAEIAPLTISIRFSNSHLDMIYDPLFDMTAKIWPAFSKAAIGDFSPVAADFLACEKIFKKAVQITCQMKFAFIYCLRR